MKVENLRAYLANINMSMKEFGEIIEYHPAYLRQIAAGTMKPSYRLAREVYKATDGIVDLQPLVPRKVKKQNQQQQENDQLVR